MYEILCLISSKTPKETIPSLVSKIENILKNFNASLVYKNELGEKKLAYPIKKEKRGYYFVIGFKLEPSLIKKFEEACQNIPEILRYQIIKIQKPLEKPIEVSKEPTKPKKIDLEKLDERIEKLLADENKLVK